MSKQAVLWVVEVKWLGKWGADESFRNREDARRYAAWRRADHVETVRVVKYIRES